MNQTTTPEAVTVEQLTGTFSIGQQHVRYVATYAIGGEAARVTITRDSYDFQSSAIAELFDPLHRKWNTVAAIEWSNMVTLGWSAYGGTPSPEQAEDTFYMDAGELVEQVRTLLTVTA